MELFSIRIQRTFQLVSTFMQGVRDVEKYKEAGITWWDYCGHTLVNSYPTYFEKLPPS